MDRLTSHCQPTQQDRNVKTPQAVVDQLTCSRRWLALAVLLWPLLALLGCCVGPDYIGPKTPMLPDAFSSAAADEAIENDDLSYWWEHFHDPVLSGLIDSAVRQNLDLQESFYRVAEARAAAGAVKGNLFPKIGANGQDTYRKSSNNAREFVPINAASQAYDLMNVGIDSTWEIDVFGGLRRALEAANRDAAAYDHARKFMQVVLTADVAINYIKIRQLQSRAAILETNLATQEHTLNTLMNRGALTGELDIREARARLRASRAQQPALRRDIRVAANHLAVLLGMPPTDLIDDLVGTGPFPEFDGALAVGVPVQLLCRRPDIWEAERRLAAASSRIGVAKSDLYPKVTLTGNVGVDTRDIASLFTAQSISHSLGPSFRWNLLSFGRVLQNVKVYELRYTQARLQLLQRILEAVEQVDNGLVAYHESLAELTEHQGAAEDFAKVVELVQLRNNSVAGANGGNQGVDTIYRLLQAQLNLLQAQDRAAISQGNALIAIVETYRALGGGWEYTPIPVVEVDSID
ncbi:MAG: TolC family protein [Planctomycetales bacterium]|nr:TolC family protein [Planctomycetales bacterium]